MSKIKVTQLNKKSSSDWENLESIALRVFPRQFRKMMLIPETGRLQDVKINGHDFIDYALFLEKDGKKVGCATLNRQHAIFGDVEPRPDTLYLSYLMMLEEESGLGYGTQLLKAVLDFAKQNGYKYIELINTINMDMFDPKHNIYLQNKFNALALYSPKNKLRDENYNLYFRIDVDSSLTNFSKALYLSYNKFRKMSESRITEVKLKRDLEKQYCDILSLTQSLTKQDLEEIKNNPLFNDLTITLSSLLQHKKKEAPEVPVRNGVKVGKMLKTINLGISKPSSSQNIVPKIYHFDKIDRILCGFADERINAETLNEISIQQKYGK